MGTTDMPEITSSFTEYAIFIVLLPMLAFPVILFLGRLFNGNETWVKSAKEGGLIALPIMVASFILSLILIVDFIGSGTGSSPHQRVRCRTQRWSDGEGRGCGLVHIPREGRSE